MEAELYGADGLTRPARHRRARQAALAQRETALLHRRVRPVPHRHRADQRPAATRARRATARCRACRAREAFTLNTAHHGGRPRATTAGWRQQRRYTDDNAPQQLDPTLDEMPGAMPEIAPSPDFGREHRPAVHRAVQVLQAWGAYGTLWPVVHQQLGVRPDLGRGVLAVVPQLPEGQDRIEGRQISGLARAARGCAPSATATAGGPRCAPAATCGRCGSARRSRLRRPHRPRTTGQPGRHADPPPHEPRARGDGGHGPRGAPARGADALTPARGRGW